MLVGGQGYQRFEEICCLHLIRNIGTEQGRLEVMPETYIWE
jgi:hypothetical protein